MSSDQLLQDKVIVVTGAGRGIGRGIAMMAAAHGAGSVVQRAKLALGAGCDMVLVCNDRESAITVADWLDTNNIPPNAGLLRMRGRPQCEGKNLYTSARWIEATEMMSTLTGNKDKVN